MKFYYLPYNFRKSFDEAYWKISVLLSGTIWESGEPNRNFIRCTQWCSRIFSLHRRILNNLFWGFCRNDECVFKKFKILKLRDVHIFNVSIYMFRIIKLNECPTLQSAIDLIYPDHEYDTRNRDLLIGEFPRVETLRYNYKYQLKKIWNDISQPIKDLTKLSTFKRVLKEHLLSKY